MTKSADFMSGEHFAGSFSNLREHWQNETRAIKFRKGQTRAKAVNYMITRIEVDIHLGSWLDTGTGSGYIQSQVPSQLDTIFFVGLDFSIEMLRAQISPYGERVQGTVFKLPFRRSSFTLSSNYFSLSDYLAPEDGLNELCRVLAETGSLVYLDYSAGDGYWEARKQFHSRQGSTGEIIGNIHLRSSADIKILLEKNLRVVVVETIEYGVDNTQFNSDFELPKEVIRKFIFCIGYKPRDSNN